MTPDYERAATMAAETLVKYGISSAPVDPRQILKQIPGTIIMTFEDVSKRTQVEREKLIRMYGCDNQDAVTTVYVNGKDLRYVVTYNKLLSSIIIDRALARELGHIVLGHDGSKPENVRNEEARCFAKHLLIPRALIHAVQVINIRLTTEVLNNLTGCSDHCLTCIRRMPCVHVPAELNRKIRDQFMPYIRTFMDFQRQAVHRDGSALADLGNYMEGYEE